VLSLDRNLTIGYVLAGRKNASRSLAKRIFALPFTAPLVLRTLAAMVTEVAPSVQHLGWDELLQGEISKRFLKKVDLVFLSGLTTATYGMQRIAKMAKELGVPVIAGGSGVTCKYFGNPEVNLPELLGHYDAVCVGRATPRIIAEIIEDHVSDKLRPMYVEQPDEPVSFIVPRHDLFRGRYLFNNVFQTSGGCLSSCNYCVVHRCLPGGKRCKIYCVPPNVIDKQLEMFAAHGSGRIFDAADSFGEDINHTYEVVLPRLADYSGGWMTEAKIKILKGKDGKWSLLKAMAKAGNIVIFAGVEDLFNKFTSKQADISDNEEFVRVARGEGIVPVCALMIGAAPNAVLEDVDRTIEWVRDNKVDVQGSLISALESSVLWEKAIKEGTLIDINPEHTDGAWPQVRHPNMRSEVLIKSLERFYRECYSLSEIYSRLRTRGFTKNSILAAVAGLGVRTSAKSWFKKHDYIYWLNNRIHPDSLYP